MIKLRFIPRIPHRVRAIMRRLVDAAPEVTEIRHRLAVYVTPAIVVESLDGTVGFGAFGVLRNRPQIWIGGHPPTKWEEAWLREVFAHELAHYEQYRDGKELSERGVKARERKLIRVFKRQCRKAPR